MDYKKDIRIVIIEDELPSARFLKRRLSELGYEVQSLLNSVEQAVEWFSEHSSPDLIFLDIHLSDGISFEIFERVEVKSAVIFTTAYDQYALRAFELNSVDYLLKPIETVPLQRALDKFHVLWSDRNAFAFDFRSIQDLLRAPKSFRQRLTLKVGQNLRVLDVDEVLFFFSANKGTYAFTEDFREYPVEMTLEELEKELNPEVFFRISRKFLVSTRACRELQVYSNSRLKLQIPRFTGEDLVVSRERVQAFRSWISQ